jgi:hypothetical protein
MYKQKYLKYREKYLNLKNELSGGVGLGDVPEDLLPKMVSDNSMTCRQTMNTAKTSKAFANAIDFPNLTNSITTNIPNINRRTSGICNQIDDVARRAQCNEYNNRCYIKELFDKYYNIPYRGQVLAAPVPPATYDLNTLNQILLRTIPNNIEDPDKVIDQQNLIRFGANLTQIDTAAFFQNDLRSITIPDSVININERAFDQNQLTELIIPDSVITIGHYAFEHNQLIRLTIPKSVKSMSHSVFGYNQLEEVTLPRIFEHQIYHIFGPDISNIIFTYTD